MLGIMLLLFVQFLFFSDKISKSNCSTLRDFITSNSQKLQLKEQVAHAFLDKFQLRPEEIKILRGTRDGALHAVSILVCWQMSSDEVSVSLSEGVTQLKVGSLSSYKPYLSCLSKSGCLTHFCQGSSSSVVVVICQHPGNSCSLQQIIR